MPLKYDYIILGAFLLCVFLFGRMDNATVTGKELPLFGKIIYVDPGHEGHGVSQK